MPNDKPQLEPELQRYIDRLMYDMIGPPHILNPFNTGRGGIDLREGLPCPPKVKP